MAAKTSTERTREWRQRHPEKKSESTERTRAWRKANPEQNLLQQRASDARRRQNKATRRDLSSETRRTYEREVRQAAIKTEKLQRGACLDCGLAVTVDNLVVFDFDHRDPNTKRTNIAGTSINYLAEEMAKCDLRCSNCHRLKTWRQKDWHIPHIIQPADDTLF